MKLGRKAVSDHLVVYLNNTGDQAPFRLGLVVGKTVGNAVERNLVKRRARSAIQERMNMLVTGDIIVVRALPGSAKLPWSGFCEELDQNINRLKRTQIS